MDIEDEDPSDDIARAWGVDPDLLSEVEWELETLDGNDGEIYGYVVRFDDDADEDILEQLGVSPGEQTREVPLNAFDRAEPDYDDGNALSGSGATNRSYLLTEDGSIVTTEDGSPIILEDAVRQPSGTEVTQASLQKELLQRVQELERVVAAYRISLPPRGHNKPPELIDQDALSSNDLAVIDQSLSALKTEGSRSNPDPAVTTDAAITLQRIATSLTYWIGSKVDIAATETAKWSGRALPPAAAFHIPEIREWLISVADKALELVQLVGASF